MRRLTENKIILVTRPTRVQEMKRRHATADRAAFYMEHLGHGFAAYRNEDAIYMEAVRAAAQQLEELGRLQVIDRSFLPNFVFGPEDIVVVLGQDGLVANTVKYLAGQPVIGVNPDPTRWDGQLLPFKVADLAKITPEVFRRRRATKSVTMAQADLNTGEKMYAVNDLFIGPRTHSSARYTIYYDRYEEDQSSSGVIISTGVGSTGWFKSLMAGATGIVHHLRLPTGGRIPPALPGKTIANAKILPADLAPPVPGEFPWDADYLYFTVREPFPSKTTRASLVFGRITAKQPLHLVSQMPENGVVFSDGIEQDSLEFRTGTQAIITIADKRGCLVI